MTVDTWKLNGAGLRPIDLQPRPKNLNEASVGLPDGVYTTLRTYGSRILPLEDSLRRLEESAALSDRPISLDRDWIRQALRQALKTHTNGERRIRLSVDLEGEPGAVYLSLEPLSLPPAEAYEAGVWAVTVPLHRQNPKAKRTDFIAVAEKVRGRLPAGAHEGLLLDEAGRILEGLSSNFFAVISGELWTAEAEVLAGLTRAVVLAVVRREGLPVRLEAVASADLARLDEAFLTSASRAILPVRQIDSEPIGPCCPGPLTRRLMLAYWEEFQAQLEEV